MVSSPVFKYSPSASKSHIILKILTRKLEYPSPFGEETTSETFGLDPRCLRCTNTITPCIRAARFQVSFQPLPLFTAQAAVGWGKRMKTIIWDPWAHENEFVRWETHQLDKNMGRRMREREGAGNLSITWKAQITTCLHERHSSGLSNLCNVRFFKTRNSEELQERRAEIVAQNQISKLATRFLKSRVQNADNLFDCYNGPISQWRIFLAFTHTGSCRWLLTAHKQRQIVSARY